MDKTSIANISTEIFGAVLSFIIIIYLKKNDTKNTKLNRLFIQILICNIVNLLSDTACWAVMGNTEIYAFVINYAGTFLMYAFNYIILAAFADYLFAYISFKTEVSKKYIYAIRILTALSVMLLVISQFTRMYYYIDNANIYHRSDFFIYIFLSEILCMVIIGAMIIRYKKNLSKWDFIFFSSYVVLPALAAVIQFMFYGIAPIYVATTLSVLIIFLGIQNEQTKLLKQQELELIESRISVMLSQIQPHFLYNSLVAIKQLCRIDPTMAEQAVTEFSSYLRGNLDSLTQKQNIPFEKELNHVQTYLSLEKKRFGEKLNVELDIKTKDFLIPCLTLQPIVENAVRYGITKCEKNGTVTIRTEETDDVWCIAIIDDGAGFDPAEPKQDGHSHVGIDSVRSRLASMCGGTLTIKSVIGGGTTAVITIPKGGKPYECYSG